MDYTTTNQLLLPYQQAQMYFKEIDNLEGGSEIPEPTSSNIVYAYADSDTLSEAYMSNIPQIFSPVQSNAFLQKCVYEENKDSLSDFDTLQCSNLFDDQQLTSYSPSFNNLIQNQTTKVTSAPPPTPALSYSMTFISTDATLYKMHLMLENVRFKPEFYIDGGVKQCSQIFNFNIKSGTANAQQLQTALAQIKCSLYDFSQYAQPKPNQKDKTLVKARTFTSITKVSDIIKQALLQGTMDIRFTKGATIDTNESSIIVGKDDQSLADSSYCLNKCSVENICTKCIGDQYLDLNTYQCVNACPADSLAFNTAFTFNSNQYSKSVNYCRSYNNDTKEITIYVTDKEDQAFEDGTEEYPYSNIVFGFLEAFNFRANCKGLKWKFVLLDGKHFVFSGAFPLFAANNYITITSIADDNETNPLLMFTTVKEATFKTYFNSLAGRSIAQINYLYNTVEKAISLTFYELYPKAHIIVYQSNLIINKVNIRQVTEICKDDAIVTFIGRNNTVAGIAVIQSGIQVHRFIINANPVAINIVACSIDMENLDFFMNSKYITNEDYPVNIVDCLFNDTNTQTNLVTSFTPIYIIGYRTIVIKGNRFLNYRNQNSMSLITIAYIQESQQNKSSINILQNVFSDSKDVNIYIANYICSHALDWDIKFQGNSFTNLVQNLLQILYIAGSDSTTGKINLSGNYFKNIVLYYPKTETVPIDIYRLASMKEVAVVISNDVFRGIKTLSLMRVTGIKLLSSVSNQFMDLEPPSVCNKALYDNSLPAYINIFGATSYFQHMNQFNGVILGRHRALLWLFQVKDITVQNSLFDNFKYFDGSRLANFQSYQTLVFTQSTINRFVPVDLKSNFLIMAEIGSSTTKTEISNNAVGNFNIGLSDLICDKVSNSAVVIKGQTYANTKMTAQNQIKQAVCTFSGICQQKQYFDTKTSTCKGKELYNQMVQIAHLPIAISVEMLLTVMLANLDLYSMKQLNNVKQNPLQTAYVRISILESSVVKEASTTLELNNANVYLINLNFFKACVQGCEICSDGQTCNQCYFGMFFDTASKKCVPLQGYKGGNCQGCFDVQSIDNCLKCNPYTSLVNGGCQCNFNYLMDITPKLGAYSMAITTFNMQYNQAIKSQSDPKALCDYIFTFQNAQTSNTQFSQRIAQEIGQLRCKFSDQNQQEGFLYQRELRTIVFDNYKSVITVEGASEYLMTALAKRFLIMKVKNTIFTQDCKTPTSLDLSLDVTTDYEPPVLRSDCTAGCMMCDSCNQCDQCEPYSFLDSKTSKCYCQEKTVVTLKNTKTVNNAKFVTVAFDLYDIDMQTEYVAKGAAQSCTNVLGLTSSNSQRAQEFPLLKCQVTEYTEKQSVPINDLPLTNSDYIVYHTVVTVTDMPLALFQSIKSGESNLIVRDYTYKVMCTPDPLSPQYNIRIGTVNPSSQTCTTGCALCASTTTCDICRSNSVLQSTGKCKCKFDYMMDSSKTNQLTISTYDVTPGKKLAALGATTAQIKCLDYYNITYPANIASSDKTYIQQQFSSVLQCSITLGTYQDSIFDPYNQNQLSYSLNSMTFNFQSWSAQLKDMYSQQKFSIQLNPLQFTQTCDTPTAMIIAYKQSFAAPAPAPPPSAPTNSTKPPTTPQTLQAQPTESVKLTCAPSSGYAFITFFNYTVNSTCQHDVECDLYYDDPINNFTVRLKQEWTVNNTAPGEARSLLPYFPNKNTINIQLKCTKLNKQVVTDSCAIPVEVNKKFFSHYSVRANMTLLQTYLLIQEMQLFKGESDYAQFKIDLSNLAASLTQVELIDSNDLKMFTFVMNALVTEIKADPTLIEGTNIVGDLTTAINRALPSKTSGIDVKSQQLSQSIDQATFTTLTAILNYLVTLNKKTTQNIAPTQEPSSLVQSFQIGLTSLTPTLDKDKDQIQIQGDSISGTLQKVSSNSMQTVGTQIQVPASNSATDPTSKGIKINIPPTTTLQTTNDNVYVRAVAVDSNVVKSNSPSITDQPTNFASDVVIMNIDTTDANAQVSTLSVKNLVQPIELEIPINNPQPNTNYQCSTYDEDKGRWVTIEGSQSSDSSAMYCKTTHLSQFAVLIVPEQETYLVGIVVVILDVFFFAGIMVAVILDKREKDEDGDKSQNTTQRKLYKMMQAQYEDDQHDLLNLESEDFSKESKKYKRKNQLSGQKQSRKQRMEYIRDEPFSFMDMLHLYHRVINSFNELGIQRVYKTLSNFTQFYLLFLLIALLHLSTNLHVVATLAIVFVIVRIVQILLNQFIDQLFTKNLALKITAIVIMALVIVGSQVGPILISSSKDWLARYISIATAGFLVFEIFIWDLLIYPGIAMVWHKCRSQRY